MTREAAIALAAGIPAAVWLLTVLLWWRSRRRMRQRVYLAVARLDPSSPPEVRSTESTLAQLERTVDAAVTREGETSASETRMAHALDAIDDGIVLLDEDAQILFRNPRARTFLRARHGEAPVGSAIGELAQRALGGESVDQQLEVFGPPRRTLVLTADPLDDGFRSVGVLVVIADVTEQQRLEAVRRDFVANISHELKTPIGSLSVLAETMVDEDDTGILRRLAQRVHREALRASRAIDDLLELSRIELVETGMRDPVPVHLVLAESVERRSPGAERRGVTLELQEPPHDLELLGDRRQLVSAVSNLVDNAIKYSNPGSTVTVRATTDGDRIRLQVADRGIGIAGRDHDRIFERFYRVDRSRSRESGGAGLGLAIVRHVVANHGGEVEVESREGEGSTFTLVLPAAPGPTAASPGTGEDRHHA